MSDAQKVTAAAIVAALAALGAGLALKGEGEVTKEPPAKESALEVDVAVKELDPAPDEKSKVREYVTTEGRIFAYESAGKLVQAPPQCVIPACADDVGPVDCLLDGKWHGCNVIHRDHATGTECKPASCVLDFGEVEAAAAK